MVRSIERRFNDISKKNPYYSSFTCFSEAIKEQNFNKYLIKKWFFKLVDKEDYSKEDGKDIIKHLVKIGNPKTIEDVKPEPNKYDKYY